MFFFVKNYPVSLTSPGRGLLSIMLGFSSSIQMAAPASSTGILYSGKRNSNRHILLVKIRNAYEQRTLPQIIINTCEGEGISTQSKMMVATNNGCFHIYRIKLFNDKPILRFGAAHFLFILVVSSSWTSLFVLFPA